MSAIAPVAASSFAPEERQPQSPARESRGRTGRHEPIRSRRRAWPPAGPCSASPWPPGVASGSNYLEQDLEAALLAGAQVGLEQAARRTAGHAERGRALGLLGRVAVLRALL